MCWAIFSRYCGQRTMTIKGAKRNVPHLLQAQQAPIYLWSISETLRCQKFRGIVAKSTVSNRVCWSLKVLWGSVSADFRQLQVGGEGKKERKIRDWQEEWMNPNSHTPHLQAQLAFAWHNRLGDWHPFRVVLVWAYRGLTGGFLLLQNFSVAIVVSPHVCFILVLILISMFLR